MKVTPFSVISGQQEYGETNRALLSGKNGLTFALNVRIGNEVHVSTLNIAVAHVSSETHDGWRRYTIDGTVAVDGVHTCVVMQYTPTGFFTAQGTGFILHETSNSHEERKATVLMTIIFKMIAKYQEANAGALNEDIFKLFESAKVVSWAKDSKALDRAVADIPKVTVSQ